MIYITNLWYSYLSRRLWETSKEAYGICPAYEYKEIITFYIYCFLAGILYLSYVKTTKVLVIFVIFIWIPFACVLILNHLVSRSTGLYRWIIDQYALQKEYTVKPNNKQNNTKYNKSIHPDCILGEGGAYGNISNIRKHIAEDEGQQAENLFSVTFVTNRQSINYSHKGINEGKNKNNNDKLLYHGIIEILGDHKGSKSSHCIEKCTADKNHNFIKDIPGIKTSTLKITLPNGNNIFSKNNFGNKKSKTNKNWLGFATNGYHARRSVQQSSKKDMPELMDNQGAIVEHRYRNKPNNQKNNLIQNKYLLSEYSKLERILWLLIAPIWVPLAFIDGGLRQARRINQKPFNKWIPVVDSIFLFTILSMNSTLFFFFLTAVFGLQSN